MIWAGIIADTAMKTACRYHNGLKLKFFSFLEEVCEFTLEIFGIGQNVDPSVEGTSISYSPMIGRAT